MASMIDDGKDHHHHSAILLSPSPYPPFSSSFFSSSTHLYRIIVQVDIFSAVEDAQNRVLYRSVLLSRRFDCAANMVPNTASTTNNPTISTPIMQAPTMLAAITCTSAISMIIHTRWVCSWPDDARSTMASGRLPPSYSNPPAALGYHPPPVGKQNYYRNRGTHPQ